MRKGVDMATRKPLLLRVVTALPGRNVFFFVPETSRTTRVHVISTVKMENPRSRWLMPLFKLAAGGVHLGRDA